MEWISRCCGKILSRQPASLTLAGQDDVKSGKEAFEKFGAEINSSVGVGPLH
jgi:hypothetical protein